MRFMILVKASKESEAGTLPTEQELAEMGKFNEEMIKAGVMLAGDGLKQSSFGTRIQYDGKQRTIVDGPFSETKELVAGYWIWQVKSMEEALAWAQRCPDPMPGEEGLLEIRPFYENEDFGGEFTPELQARDKRMRETIEKQS